MNRTEELHRILSGLTLLLLVGCASELEGSTGDGGAGGEGGGGMETTSGGNAVTSGNGGADTAVCDATPCGGDLLGVWRYAETCGETPWLEEACGPGNSLIKRSRYVYRLEGTATFGDDGHVEIERQVHAGWDIYLPKECMLPNATCAAVVQGDGVVCDDLPDACDCTSVVGGPLESAVEPYEAAGHELIVGADAEQATLDYCVMNRGLKMVHPETGETTYLERE